MTAAHTPGQWVLEASKNGAFAIVVEGPRYAVIASRNTWDHRADESYANARLMVASPELLAALIDARSMLACAVRAATHEPGEPEFDVRQHHGIKKIDAAIAKATGEQQ